MQNVDYSKPFTSLETITKIVDLTIAGRYARDDLVNSTSKLLNITSDYISNSVQLLEIVKIIAVNPQGIYETNQSLKFSIAKHLLSKLEEDGVLHEIAEAMEELDGFNEFKLNHFKLFPKYRGAIPLVASLGLLAYDSKNQFYKITESGYELLSSLILKSSFNAFDQGMSPKQLENKLELQAIRGNQAEEFVLEFEKLRLKNHPHFHAIKRVSLTNTSAGFDIQSFESNKSTCIDKFIEVKSYTGQAGFYWSINEINFAKKKGSAYCLMIVDSNKIYTDEYEPSEIRNPYMIFDMNKHLPQDALKGIFDIQPTNFYISPKE